MCIGKERRWGRRNQTKEEKLTQPGTAESGGQRPVWETREAAVPSEGEGTHKIGERSRFREKGSWLS